MNSSDSGNAGLRGVLLAAVLAGVFLRLYLLSDQILLDDEWHGLVHASSHSVGNLLFHPVGGANSAPLNAYYRLLLDTIGWSEWALRLPSVASGLLALFFFCRVAWAAEGPLVAATFAVLLGLSPFLVFYSRVCRPYSPLLFLLGVSLVAGLRWLRTGEPRAASAYALASALALYFHPVALLTVLIPAGWAAASLVAPPLRSRFSVVPSTKAVVAVTAAILVASVATVRPSLVEEVRTREAPTGATWAELGLMLFGTEQPLLAGTLMLLALVGAVAMLRRRGVCGAVLVTVVVANVIGIAVSGLDCISAALVFARYVIVAFPVAHLWAAVGLSWCLTSLSTVSPTLTLHRPARLLAPALVFASLAATSPLREAYRQPNSFTNHSAFQESYAADRPLDPYRSAAVPVLAATGEPSQSPFYRRLPLDTRTIIEYPLLIQDHLDFYYVYQRRHGRRVVGGYTAQLAGNRSFGADIDFLGSVPRDRLAFRNLADITDPEAVRRVAADVLIVHLNAIHEFLPTRVPFAWESKCCAQEDTRTPGTDILIPRLQALYGAPLHRDETIVAFGLRRSGGASP